MTNVEVIIIALSSFVLLTLGGVSMVCKKVRYLKICGCCSCQQEVSNNNSRNEDNNTFSPREYLQSSLGFEEKNQNNFNNRLNKAFTRDIKLNKKDKKEDHDNTNDIENQNHRRNSFP